MPIAAINGHDMYYEIHGEGPPCVVMTGWGTFCHGGERHLARGLTDAYSVLIFDHRGIGESGDDLSVAPSTALYAADVAGLLDHLGWRDVRVIGLVGMGACMGQILAVERPDLVRSLTMMGAWASVDDLLRDQLDLFGAIHRDCGFETFQRHVCTMSFDADYYLANRHRLLGPEGGWKDLRGKVPAHLRFIEACVRHEVLDRLGAIRAPTLMIHASRDLVTGPRLTKPIAAAIPDCTEVTMDCAHVVAGREQKKEFCGILLPWLARQ